MLLLTWPVIAKLSQQSADELEELAELYGRLPATRCQRKTHCCSMLPEMTLIETFAIFKRLAALEPVTRCAHFKRISSYFFLNAARITACPFLKGRTCRVYEDRFLGCRAYGLWSSAHYRMIATRSQTAKKALQKQWQHLGVSLPQAVVDFQIPYCRDVRLVDKVDLDDETLVRIAGSVDTLSQNSAEGHQAFLESYFSDFSFLVAALLFGYRAAVQIKFDVVKELIDTGRSNKLDTILNGISDPFEAAADIN